MSTWDEATLAQKARILTHAPEATMGAVAEVFPQVYFVWSQLTGSLNAAEPSSNLSSPLCIS